MGRRAGHIAAVEVAPVGQVVRADGLGRVGGGQGAGHEAVVQIARAHAADQRGQDQVGGHTLLDARPAAQ